MSYWTIAIVVMVLSFIIQQTLNSKFNRYSKVPCSLTGAEAAEKMLRDFGINDVTVTSVRGHLTDHYNPANRTINLSEGVYGSRSIAAVAVACHETGHAVQHYQGYAPLRLRSALVPVVNFANSAVTWVMLLGFILIQNIGSPTMLWVGIGLYAMTTLFSVVTLPVEVNASRRAIRWLSDEGITTHETHRMAVSALKWAAYTYFIAAISSIAYLLYYIGIASSSRRN